MIDDDLDRALFALPLEEPPAGLRERILAATVYRVPASSPFKAWELWLLGAAVALVIVISFALLSSVPNPSDQLYDAFVHAMRSLGLFKVTTYAWVAAGVSCVWAVSSLPLMPRPRQTVYNR